jgi:DNA-binding NtrC family response regulator
VNGSPLSPVLVVEDDADLAQALADEIGQSGFATTLAADADQAVARFAEASPCAVLCDLVLPGRDGIALLREFSDLLAECPFILMSGRADIRRAVEAMQLGAFDFLEKPISPDCLRGLLLRIRQRRDMQLEIERLRREAPRSHDGGLVALSPVMRSALALAHKVAATDGPVLLTGETGSGKERFARLIHEASPRGDGPFVAVNAAAIPATLLESEFFGHERGAFTGAVKRRLGAFELAHRGTLLLDEIGELPLELQPKLLRAVERHEVVRLGGGLPVVADARIVAATNRDLAREVAAGRFRQDLFYRLNVFAMAVPPLRERGEDIEALASVFAAELAAREGKAVEGFDRAAREALRRYDWPGNVRELRNVVERAVILCSGGMITAAHLAADLVQRGLAPPSSPVGPGLTLAEAERRYVLHALERHAGSRREAARSLGISERTLRGKLRAHGLDSAREEDEIEADLGEG